MGTPDAALVLASGSPQRRAILAQLGVPFDVVVSGVEEIETGDPVAIAEENARRKASAVAADAPGRTVLGVDTVVELDGVTYGKPRDETEARETLRALRSREHAVLSGVCLIAGGDVRTAVARTDVRFRDFDEPLLDWYLGSGEWRERAGGYAIQGRGAVFVSEIRGDYFNVVGLPVAVLLELAPGLLG